MKFSRFPPIIRVILISVVVDQLSISVSGLVAALHVRSLSFWCSKNQMNPNKRRSLLQSWVSSYGESPVLIFSEKSPSYMKSLPSLKRCSIPRKWALKWAAYLEPFPSSRLFILCYRFHFLHFVVEPYFQVLSFYFNKFTGSNQVTYKIKSHHTPELFCTSIV